MTKKEAADAAEPDEPEDDDEEEADEDQADEPETETPAPAEKPVKRFSEDHPPAKRRRTPIREERAEADLASQVPFRLW